jgi:hypothetical protein
VFINHGEPVPADALRLGAEERFGWRVRVAEHNTPIALPD